MTQHQFSELALNWFDLHGRKNLPWQQNTNAYRVWISEIMLQQTQVATVIPYYKKFMQSFPDIQSLAAASEDKVLSHWSGLGYYARARNLHKTAKLVVELHDGELPDNTQVLQELPGIGRSTAGAILSLAYQQCEPILDGNVKRVLARVHCIEGWPGHTQTLKQLWGISEQVTPAQRTANFNQAMMDLGATVCMRSKPLCESCPLISLCQAQEQGRQTEYPSKKPKKSIPTKETVMILAQDASGGVLLYKRPPVGIWGGLWSLPEIESQAGLEAWCQEQGLVVLDEVEEFANFRHTFSHYHLQITAISLKVRADSQTLMEDSSKLWYKGESDVGGMASPVSKLVQQLLGVSTHDKNG